MSNTPKEELAEKLYVEIIARLYVDDRRLSTDYNMSQKVARATAINCRDMAEAFFAPVPAPTASPPKPAASGVVGQKVIYTGIFLTPEAKYALLRAYPPRHSTVHADHVTLVFKPGPEELKILEPHLEKLVLFRVTGEVYDERGQCVRVELPEPYWKFGGQDFHITVSCAEGTGPVYSNELLKKAVGLPSVGPTGACTGVVRHFTK